MGRFKIGQKVEWKWQPGFVTGTVKEIFTAPVARTIKGSVIRRNGSPANPAYLILTKKNVEVLKLDSELYDGESVAGKAEAS